MLTRGPRCFQRQPVWIAQSNAGLNKSGNVSVIPSSSSRSRKCPSGNETGGKPPGSSAMNNVSETVSPAGLKAAETAPPRVHWTGLTSPVRRAPRLLPSLRRNGRMFQRKCPTFPCPLRTSASVRTPCPACRTGRHRPPFYAKGRRLRKGQSAGGDHVRPHIRSTVHHFHMVRERSYDA